MVAEGRTEPFVHSRPADIQSSADAIVCWQEERWVGRGRKTNTFPKREKVVTCFRSGSTVIESVKYPHSHAALFMAQAYHVQCSKASFTYPRLLAKRIAAMASKYVHLRLLSLTALSVGKRLPDSDNPLLECSSVLAKQVGVGLSVPISLQAISARCNVGVLLFLRDADVNTILIVKADRHEPDMEASVMKRPGSEAHRFLRIYFVIRDIKHIQSCQGGWRSTGHSQLCCFVCVRL